MSAPWQLVVYLLAVVCFLAAFYGVTTLRHPLAFGWLGAALVTLVPLVSAFRAL
jgi:hypothetical protein